MRRSIFIVIAIAVSALMQAQSDVEALRYASTQNLGTARYVGTGGAFGALGADFTTLSNNPGGIGVYRHSSITSSGGFFAYDNSASFFGTKSSSGKAYLYFPNGGLVIARKKKQGKEKGWRFVNYGFGVNRLANYRNNLSFTGVNPYNSMLEQFTEKLNANGGTPPGDVFSSFPYDAGLAYETYLLDPAPNDTTRFVSKIPYGGARQTVNINTKGRMRELVFAVGGNYNDKLFIGASLNFPGVKYQETKSFSEEDFMDSIADFSSYTFNQYLTSEASGVNLKFGMIYWVTPTLRVGAALHSPGYLSFEDRFYADMQSDLESDQYTYETLPGRFSYTLITPMKMMFSAAKLFGKKGLIAAEVESYDPGTTRYYFTDGGSKVYENELNTSISDKYQRVYRVKVGAEASIKGLRLRAGAFWKSSVFTDAYKPSDQADYAGTGYSLGVGFRSKYFFADAAFQNTVTDYAYVPYTLNNPDETVGGALVDQNSYNLIFTLGVNF